MNVQAQVLVSHLGNRPRRAAAWWVPREAALNWIALGLLLGAWNAVDDGTSRQRPQPLRGYDAVSVRAVQRGQQGP